MRSSNDVQYALAYVNLVGKEVPMATSMMWHAALRVGRERLGKKPSAVADVGTADGAFLRYVHTQFPRASLQGVEPNDALRERASLLARAQRVEVRFVRGLAENLPMGSCEFDVVFAHELIQLLSDASLGSFLDRLRLVLKPGGVAVLSMVHPLRVQERWGMRLSDASTYSCVTSWDVLSEQSYFRTQAWYQVFFGDFSPECTEPGLSGSRPEYLIFCLKNSKKR